jgi:predicted transcriptional regulator
MITAAAASPTRIDGHVLATLRALVPLDPPTSRLALAVAEAQATWLLEYREIVEPPVFASVVSRTPHIRIRLSRQLPVSGMTVWDGDAWMITLNATEPWTRRRLTLAHEFKHVIDHGHLAKLYPGRPDTAHRRAEMAADYFAGCLLMPTRLVSAAAKDPHADVAGLAARFAVSETAMRVRLRQLRINLPGAPQPEAGTPRVHALRQVGVAV